MFDWNLINRQNYIIIIYNCYIETGIHSYNSMTISWPSSINKTFKFFKLQIVFEQNFAN